MTELSSMGASDRAEMRTQACVEAVQWDEYGQGYNTEGELVVCICGEPYPLRQAHYCPYDEPAEADEENQ